MMVAFGLIFQTPLVVLTLAKTRLVTPRSLRRYRRHVVVGCLVVAGVLTPPDVLSQIMLAVPMWLLYETGVVLAWVLVFRRDQ